MFDYLNISLNDGAFRPGRAHPTDAGLDLYATEDQIIPARGVAVFDTGVRVQIPRGYAGILASKSGLMRDCHITSQGLIDSDYRGPIQAIVFNHGDQDIPIQAGQKITQLVLVAIATPDVRVIDSLPKTERGDNGFGSSGSMYGGKTYFALCHDQDNERFNVIPNPDSTVCGECCPIDFDQIDRDLARHDEEDWAADEEEDLA